MAAIYNTNSLCPVDPRRAAHAACTHCTSQEQEEAARVSESAACQPRQKSSRGHHLMAVRRPPQPRSLQGAEA
eukprot:117104-Rhodomonas_salina.1